MGPSSFLNSDGSPFLKIGITLTSLSLSVNMPVFITWFINMVNDLMMASSIIFNSFEEMPSQRKLFFFGKALYCFLYSFFIYILKSENRVNLFFK